LISKGCVAEGEHLKIVDIDCTHAAEHLKG